MCVLFVCYVCYQYAMCVLGVCCVCFVCVCVQYVCYVFAMFVCYVNVEIQKWKLESGSHVKNESAGNQTKKEKRSNTKHRYQKVLVRVTLAIIPHILSGVLVF